MAGCIMQLIAEDELKRVEDVMFQNPLYISLSTKGDVEEVDYVRALVYCELQRVLGSDTPTIIMSYLDLKPPNRWPSDDDFDWITDT